MNPPAPPRDPLFQRSWWAKRLQSLQGPADALELVPRPDLSTPGRLVEELRLRTHDGEPLFALLARPRGVHEPVPTRIRCCGPADPPELDAAAAREGVAEIVVQEVAGRRLEDRVLDMVSTFRVARSAPGLDARRVAAPTPRPGQDLPDELRIAQQLSDWNFC